VSALNKSKRFKEKLAAKVIVLRSMTAITDGLAVLPDKAENTEGTVESLIKAGA
jgi:hypothetical protein